MLVSYHLNDIDQIAELLYTKLVSSTCIAFYADMGSGKTTLIRALCTKMGVCDQVNSPTYSIINEYLIPGRIQKVYHMDWYRLKNEQDAIEAGVQDIMQQPNVFCFIEWPEVAEKLLPRNVISVKISVDSPEQRTIRFD
jgi:tRNA threonylcarbamoyladenosine biosynthesis protein TsaE